jgi:hypothetical protein
MREIDVGLQWIIDLGAAEGNGGEKICDERRFESCGKAQISVGKMWRSSSRM